MKDSVEIAKKKHLRKQILEHLLGPFGSILFHVLVVILAIKFLGMVTDEKTASIQVQIMEPDAIDLEEFEKDLQEMQELQDMEDLITPPDQVIDTAAPPDVNTDASPTEDVSMDLADLNVLSDAQSPLVMKGLYEGRSSAGRSKMLGAAGKWAEATERSVIKALEWLKNNQAGDGSWGGNDKEAMTGLAVLTFLAHGETPSSEKYGATVEKGIRFLVDIQDKNGGGKFAGWNPGECKDDGDARSYAHGIATYAIAEAYGLTRIPSLKGSMEAAVDVILNGQQSGGSWDYRYCKGSRRDASVAGWQVQALKAALIAGAENPGLKDAIHKAAEEMKAHQNAETGMFPYSGADRGKLSITGVSVLCLEVAGYGKDSATKKGLQALREADIDWNKPMDWAMYSWYYITQAKFHSGGADWNEWNQKFARELTRNQNEDGSWTAPSMPGETGEKNHGPVYATTLAALTLQVYYRFLPSYKPIEEEQEKPAEKDVTIEII